MTPQELYEIWAPPGTVWAAWAKPVIFAQMDIGKRKTDSDIPEQVTLQPSESMDWMRRYRTETALVINLPGTLTIEAALQAANYGFRPVPLFNCANSPVPKTAVDVDALAVALARGAPLLNTFNLPSDAPPAFLLDSQRSGTSTPKPNEFDNRWVIFPQDFPSATFLQTQGIRRIVIVQPRRTSQFQQELSHDLYPVIHRWHSGGLEVMLHEMTVPATSPEGGIESSNLLETAEVRPLTFGRLSRFRLGVAGFIGLMFSLATRRSSGGGFGFIVPNPSSTGGG